MLSKVYGTIALTVILISSFLYVVNLAVKNEQVKIDKAIVKHVSKTSKAKAKQTIKKIKDLYDDLEPFEATDITCDSDGVSCELW